MTKSSPLSVLRFGRSVSIRSSSIFIPNHSAPLRCFCTRPLWAVSSHFRMNCSSPAFFKLISALSKSLFLSFSFRPHQSTGCSFPDRHLSRPHALSAPSFVFSSLSRHCEVYPCTTSVSMCFFYFLRNYLPILFVWSTTNRSFVIESHLPFDRAGATFLSMSNHHRNHYQHNCGRCAE